MAIDYNSYSTLMDVRQEAGIAGNVNIDDGYVQKFRDAAVEEVNAYLSKYYSIPFNDVPELIKRITSLLAAGRLLMTTFSGIETGSEEEGKKKVDEAYSILEKIAKGELELVDSNGNITARRDFGIEGYPNDSVEPEEKPKFSIKATY